MSSREEFSCANFFKFDDQSASLSQIEAGVIAPLFFVVSLVFLLIAVKSSDKTSADTSFIMCGLSGAASLIAFCCRCYGLASSSTLDSSRRHLMGEELGINAQQV